MTDLMLAKEELSRHTLALAKDGEVITSDKRGVAPMVDFLREGKSFSGFFAADKVIGKAAAGIERTEESASGAEKRKAHDTQAKLLL